MKYIKLKKIFRIVAIAAIVSLFPAMASAQKGEKTLGVAGGFASFNKSGMAGVYFQYSFAEHVRISPEVDYVFRNDGKSGLAASIDMHFPFRVARGFKLYPLAGVAFNNWSFPDGESKSRCVLDFGGVLDLYMTTQLKLTVQGKYSLLKDTGGAFVTVGLGYVF